MARNSRFGGRNMTIATQKRSTLQLGSDKLRLHGWAMGLILLAASLLVASSVTAVINFILIAIPVLTIVAVIAMFVMGPPMIAAGIEARREARALDSQAGPTLLALNGSWKHPHAWQRGYHPHFLGFQPLDRRVGLHLDSEYYDTRGLENTLEGLTNWRR
jgi:hypothetical protein